MNLTTAQLYKSDAYRQKWQTIILKVQAGAIALKETYFYPTGGGQPGDTGKIILDNGQEILISDTQRDNQHDEVIWHFAQSELPENIEGMQVECSLDWQRRYAHMQMHTCLHLLCCTIKEEVTGCSIGQYKSRSDFNMPQLNITKQEVTQRLNQMIEAARPVRSFMEQDENAYSNHSYAPSLMPPKSAAGISMVEISDLDLQPCGGTHVRNTKEISAVACVKIENKGRNNRRFHIAFESPLEK